MRPATVFSIVTDSRGPREVKDPTSSSLFQLFQAFAGPEETATMRTAFNHGIPWGEVKQVLLERKALPGEIIFGALGRDYVLRTVTFSSWRPGSSTPRVLRAVACFC